MSDIKMVPTREKIELRAYEIYLERGGKAGNALDHWLAAERNYWNQKSEDYPTLW